MLKHLLFLGLLATFGVCDTGGPIVRTSAGLVRGTFKLSRKGRIFAAFDGIPYAQSPIGPLRFRPPVPKASWTHILDATSNNISCVQIRHEPSNPSAAVGTEDCLLLNVYTPQLNMYHTLDVIVFFHGGAFMFGSADTHSAYNLMDRPVVLVMANYRLGPLAGGASVHYHLLSPLSRGLFHRGISASGTALCNWALAESPLQKTWTMGKLLGCTQNNTHDLVECLRNKTAAEITETVKHFQPWLYNPYSPFAPSVERAGKYRFLPDLPYTLLKHGQLADVPWLTSVTSEEGLYPASDLVSNERIQVLNQHWTELAPYILHYDGTVPPAQQAIVAEKIGLYYLKGEPISRRTFPALVQAIGDRLFVVDAEKAARLQAQVNQSPVYLYRFSYRGSISLSQLFTQDTTLGVAHMDDLFYILSPDVKVFTDYLKLDADKAMVEILLDIWTSFASTGTPTISNVPWCPVSPNRCDKLNYLQITSPSNITFAEINYLGHRPFWNMLPFQENEKLSL
ncbi:uncharacterized protein CBL_07834 [Carabus blaptoides fortunei]